MKLSKTNISELKTSLERDGFVCIRGLVPRKTVKEARDFVLSCLSSQGHICHEKSPEAICYNGKSPNLLERHDVAFSEQVTSATNHPNVTDLIASLLSDTPLKRHNVGCLSASKPPPPDPTHTSITQIPISWLRAVSTDECTGPHMDRVYLGAGSQNILTVWMPLTDVPISRGSMCMARRSHKSPELERLRAEYGSVPAGRDGTSSGWVTEYPDKIEEMYGAAPGAIEWVTRDFAMGDVVVFGLDVLHMTLNNTTRLWRVSCETRWQPTDDPYPPFFHTKTR
ncbi:hypothetical protein HDU84_006275 [Entophlyctis sp. JEL0112]|nr:hypothetical protein HDU84_006275 [Entophlyctis sp. JEL0112]